MLMNQISDIFAIVDSDQNLDYNTWKTRRKNIINSIGPLIFNLSENELISTFASWEKSIHNASNTDKQRIQMNLLMAFSILSHFQDNYDHIKRLMNYATNLLSSKVMDVANAASKTLYWIAIELTDSGLLFRDTISNVFEWLETKPKLAINALEVLKRTRKFNISYVINTVIKKFKTIFQYAISEDPSIRILAAQVISYQIQALDSQTTQKFVLTPYSTCMNYILQNKTPQTQGPLRIIRAIIPLYPHFFLQNYKVFVKALIDLASNSCDDLSLEALYAALEIAKTNILHYTDNHITNLFSALCTKCLKSNQMTPFFKILDIYIRFFRPHKLVPYLVDFVYRTLMMPNLKKLTPNGLFILSTIFEIFPDAKIRPEALKDVYPCDNFIKCIKMKMSLLNQIRPYLISILKKGLSPKAPESSIIMSLKLIQAFPLNLLEKKSKLLSDIQPLMECTQESIKIELLKAFATIQTSDSLSIILNFALYDPCEEVRFSSIKALEPTEELSFYKNILLSLNDPSFNVRREALKLVSGLSEFNPFDINPTLIDYVRFVITAMKSISDVRLSSQYASLLPIVAEKMSNNLISLVPSIISLCLGFLCHDSKTDDIQTVQSDDFRDPQNITADLEKFKKSEPKRYRVYTIINSKYFDLRDAYLLDTLAILGQLVEPYMQRVLLAFHHIFISRQSSELLEKAINSLAKLASSISTGLNIRLYCPQIITALMKLLSARKGKKVSIAILKLLGTACDISNLPNDHLEENSQTNSSLNMKHPGYFTNFTLSHLVPCFDQPSMPVFEAVAMIFDSTPVSASFAVKIIPAFISGIENAVDSRSRDILFTQLNWITSQCPRETIILLPLLAETAKSYINLVACMEMCITLSYNLIGTFTESAKKLYFPALKMIESASDELYLKELLTFICYVIIFQNQPFELFIQTIELLLPQKVQPFFIKRVCNALTLLIQNCELTMYQSRIALIISQLFKYATNKSDVIEICYTSAAYLGTPLTMLEFWQITYGIKLENINVLRSLLSSQSTIDPKLCDFIPQMKPVSPKVVLDIPSITEISDIFTGLNIPDDLNISKWLDELCERVIQYSPSPAIRACKVVVSLNNNFRIQLFPIAFFSCWLKADKTQREAFSSIVNHIITHCAQIDPFFSKIAEILDRANEPLLISDRNIAKCCDSRPLKLYFTQRLYRDNMKDPQIVDLLMQLNTSMGRLSSARGLLVDAKETLAAESAGKWSEMLGKWDNALEIYKKDDENNPNLITVYSNLEQWKNIISFEPLFENMSRDDQQKFAAHFALAFFQVGELNRAEKYMTFFPPELTMNQIFFQAVFYTRTQKLDLAEQSINKGLINLAQDNAAYSSGDAYRVHENIAYAHAFVELQEVIDTKRNSKKITAEIADSIWSKRLTGFKRDSDGWIKLIRVRSLVSLQEQYTPVYLKLISVLRKERCWKLIDTYFDRFFSGSILPEVEFAQSKILWARGRRQEAIDNLRYLFEILQMKDETNFLKTIEKIKITKVTSILNSFFSLNLIDADLSKEIKSLLPHDTIKGSLKNVIKSLPNELQYKILLTISQKYPTKVLNMCKESFRLNKLTNQFRANVNRLLATYISFNDDLSFESMKEVLLLFEISKEESNSDYRTWLGWAYTNSRLININPEEKDKYSYNAVTGFLKATQLTTKGTLEYLCQMFSIFFQMTNSSLINSDLLEKLRSLPPQDINQIIPQITVQINHKDEFIRNAVHEILKNFGEIHFQALFYPLKLYENCQNQEKAMIAKSLIQKISKNHEEEYADAELFVDGLLRSASSWFEEWLMSIDLASRADHEHNKAKMESILQRQFVKYQNPKCDFDKWFVKLHDQLIQQAKSCFVQNTPESRKMMWDIFKHIFKQLTERVKKLDLVLLPKVSENLAMKVGFKIVIPGTYSFTHPAPLLKRIEPALQVLSTQQHPRCVLMVDEKGDKVKFLLKGNEDLRLDQRVMQFFVLINSLLNNSRQKREIPAQIAQYAIIPLAPTAGLISWVTGADTLHQMICDMRVTKGIELSAEMEVISKTVGSVYQYLNKVQLLEQFYEISKYCPATEVRDCLWMRSPNAAAWLGRNRNFTITNALMSMVGYIIGLGDRHPSNIMVQRDTGRVIHIDFGDSFETAVTRPNFPEKVPFRLTRMIVCAFDNGSVEGMFRSACEDVMWMLRDNMSPIVAQLEIFIHEPLDEENFSSSNKANSRQIIDRVISKLNGRDSLYEDAAIDGEPELSVEEHVDSLIRIAADPARYITHYGGWCPFW
ncbi:protein serine/threonine kinase protein [Trichomonas vaginalis G3]|uniref:protein serine/threonine kinase protein n=1 Tax=Trichomonas vaginalis (strain ATCC PRA-98 / G3) TaxID=412133 RepID=UPI0021E55635|nr:protein serine/threonine kinase protein [Trichomonas vaginalis G3]KAI5504130.1 protein serine/threonine kinase protein [Trichomonas vaginalis G3]